MGNDVAVFFEREVPRIQQMKLKLLEVALVRVCAFLREDVVVLPPHDQRYFEAFGTRGSPGDYDKAGLGPAGLGPHLKL